MRSDDKKLEVPESELNRRKKKITFYSRNIYRGD